MMLRSKTGDKTKRITDANGRDIRSVKISTNISGDKIVDIKEGNGSVDMDDESLKLLMNLLWD